MEKNDLDGLVYDLDTFELSDPALRMYRPEGPIRSDGSKVKPEPENVSRSGSLFPKINALKSVLGYASLGAGAIHGFYDAQGTPLPQENLEFALTYGPAIVRGAFAGLLFGVPGLAVGGLLGGVAGLESSNYKSNNLEVAARGTGGAIGGSILTAGIFGGVASGYGAVKGGCQTVVGYGVGYLLGSVMN